MSRFSGLLDEIRACEICRDHLPRGPRPTLQADPAARILVVGQAPGRRVHESGIPWDDPSGRRLRSWLNLDEPTFYGRHVALVPMGFCYPGTGKSGDLPPRPECAEQWHGRLLKRLPRVGLTLLLSRYAQARYLGDRMKPTLTETVKAWREYRPDFIPLPHPSPRNNLWLKRNPWFERELIPVVRETVRRLLRG